MMDKIKFEKDEAFSLFNEIEQGGHIGRFDRKFMLKVDEVYSITICYDISCKGMYSIKKNGKTIKWNCGLPISRRINRYIFDLEDTAKTSILEFNKMVQNKEL